MQTPPIPDNESDRLEGLREMNLLDTPAEDRFDRVTRIARSVFDCEYSAINLVDSDRQWGKSTCGVEDTEAPRDNSFCAHAILDEETTVIPDSHQDERFQDNPFVTGEPKIRFYMGHPVHSPQGHRIGTLCVFDPAPREDVSENELQLIKDLASIVDSEFQRDEFHNIQANLQEKLDTAQRRSRIDKLTDLWNRRAIMEMLDGELNRSERRENDLGVMMLDIDDFKQINDTYGHPAGDAILRRVSEVLRQSIRDYDAAGRYGGEEFLVLLTEAGREEAREIAERIRSEVEQLTVKHNGQELSVTVSIGVAVRTVSEFSGSEEIISHADQALYNSKDNGKNQVTFYSEIGETGETSQAAS